MLRSSLFTFLILSFANPINAGDDEALKKLFIDGVDQTSRQLLTLQRSWKQEMSSGKVSSLDSSDEKWSNLPDFKSNFECSINGNFAIHTKSTKSGAVTVNVINDYYAFQVKKTDALKPWTIEFIEQLGKSSKMDKRLLP